ncbi:hypothetical protein CA233_20225 [Sphingomonas sp. ABOLD]|uniref:Uncharacterized protein n=1 Tax=Sphingomonas trueperi TaxID=53317 RepID=A0A7X6BDD7_9SPHN|nr:MULTISPECIES: hypothetical protein [Sphingomonas]NJB99019.1 hypothetical protein [Sphingomonas trueperi]RSV40198.1 hypothetical protein CA233_20225 [Sphingomonas sp. ABOLD]RSV45308.1 hypothetical protein CA234_00130 [Sphingomonas sp. ABOLE]
MAIEIASARALAEAHARGCLRSVAGNRDAYLREEHAEAPNCWFFFRAKDISVPPEQSLLADWAYAVSRWGDVRMIVDLSGDVEALSRYLFEMSGFFERSRDNVPM